MPRLPKKNQTSPTKRLNLADFLSGYDYKNLVGAISTFENQLGFDLLQAFLRYKQRMFEVNSLDLCAMTGKEKEAAYTSGYAKACEDMAEHFVNELKDAVLGRTGVIETPRPDGEEEIVN